MAHAQPRLRSTGRKFDADTKVWAKQSLCDDLAGQFELFCGGRFLNQCMPVMMSVYNRLLKTRTLQNMKRLSVQSMSQLSKTLIRISPMQLHTKLRELAPVCLPEPALAKHLLPGSFTHENAIHNCPLKCTTRCNGQSGTISAELEPPRLGTDLFSFRSCNMCLHPLTGGAIQSRTSLHRLQMLPAIPPLHICSWSLLVLRH